MNILVCVCTYRRPEGLKACLASLRTQTRAHEVLVVENEADGPGRAHCAGVRYAVETRPGISTVRNKCLELSDGFDVIAFIDDDEIAAPDWLERLAETQRVTGADIVCGPVYPHYAEPPPAWLKKGRFHHPQNAETGAVPKWCASGSVLFRTELVRAGLRFDERVSLMGGEDVLFFAQAMRLGFRAVWCAEALAWETVPPERTTPGWLIRRTYRIGICDTLTARALRPPAVAAALSLAAGLGRVLAHAALLPLSLWGTGARVRRLRGLGYGLGRLAGLAGLKFLEYRRS